MEHSDSLVFGGDFAVRTVTMETRSVSVFFRTPGKFKLRPVKNERRKIYIIDPRIFLNNLIDCFLWTIKWLHGSVVRALHRYHRGINGFESRCSPLNVSGVNKRQLLKFPR